MKQFLSTLALLWTCMAFLTAQNTLTGIITDEDGTPLFGVNILEKGTNNGTITDFDGSYSLDYSRNDAVIVISYTGFKVQEITLHGQSQLNVTLESGIDLTGVEIVGTRSLNRTVTESPVAIDIIEIGKVTNDVGQLEVNQILQYAAPSFNASRQSGSDGADHVDPATLRGLGPDQTLVLINGKRRHQSSNVNIFGSRGRGNTGTDLNAIPASAIERIEILRDGASAQYGSDAIAGVINIVLKSSVNEFTGNISTGVFNAKPGVDGALEPENFDGESIQINGNYGVALGENGGFFNVTTDFLSKARTNRPSDPSVFDIYREEYGDAALDNFNTFFNAALPIAGNTSFYAFGGYGYRDTDAFAWTRTPDSERNVTAIYPNGFNPHITSKIWDKSISTGMRTKLRNWEVDFNNTFGVNTFLYNIAGTLNASLEEKSPTRFDAGGYQLSQNTTGLNFTQFFPDLLAGINIAFGAEYRIDNYEIFAGEEGSYATYDKKGLPVNINTPDSLIVYLTDAGGNLIDKRTGGSQGFPGFQPANELNEFRSNFAAYADSEFDFSDRFMVGAAARFENYSDFGNTLNGKLATRLELADNLAFRASVSSGFRAPSLVQIYYNTTFTDFVSGVPIDKVIAKNNSPITRVLGIPELKEETSTNLSAGFTFRSGSFSASIDGYMVKIKDRVVLTGAFDAGNSPEIAPELDKLRVGAVQFFTNAIDTKTKGVDAILTYTTHLGNGRLAASFAANFNDMQLDKINTSDKLKGKEDIYFGRREQLFLLASAPQNKMNLALDYKLKKFSTNLRFTRFGEVRLEDFNGEDDVYKAKVVFDLTLGYDLSHNLSLRLGAANLLNVYPSAQDPGATETGGIWDAVQMGADGTFYFAKLGFKF